MFKVFLLLALFVTAAFAAEKKAEPVEEKTEVEGAEPVVPAPYAHNADGQYDQFGRYIHNPYAYNPYAYNPYAYNPYHYSGYNRNYYNSGYNAYNPYYNPYNTGYYSPYNRFAY